MKSKILKSSLASAAMYLLGANNSFALTTCPPNASPTADCQNLRVDVFPASGIIQNDYNILGSALGQPGLTVPEGVVGGEINNGSVGSIFNRFGGSAILNSGSLTSIQNTGVINANLNEAGIGLYNTGLGVINHLLNYGLIIGGDYAIRNAGTIDTLTNAASTFSNTSGMYGIGGVDILSRAD